MQAAGGAAAPGTPAFGFTLGGVRLLVPIGAAPVFDPFARIEPMPLAPLRMRGFVQRRGRVLPVLDGGAVAPVCLPVRTRRPVLILESLPEPAALLIEQPPVYIEGPLRPAPNVQCPAVPWALACGEGWQDARGEVWWTVDPVRLFETLGAR
jgi:hypothetical protein